MKIEPLFYDNFKELSALIYQHIVSWMKQLGLQDPFVQKPLRVKMPCEAIEERLKLESTFFGTALKEMVQRCETEQFHNRFHHLDSE
ncbi:MAG: hypothetical protein L3J00_06200 [Thiomicrorhabdus sp.]|nr:hypothetical protein [Thiomicrorhabdus sp.]